MRTKLEAIRPSYANVTATIALIVALGGTSYAAIALPANSVGTAQVKNGSLLKKDFKAGQLPKGAKGARGAKGATGAKGDTGAAGAPGAAGAAGAAGTAKAYAQITSAGVLEPTLTSKGITVASQPQTGWYCLAFDPALGITTTSFIMVENVPIAADRSFPIELRWGSPTCGAGQLAVITYDSAAYNAANRAFQILVP